MGGYIVNAIFSLPEYSIYLRCCTLVIYEVVLYTFKIVHFSSNIDNYFDNNTSQNKNC